MPASPRQSPAFSTTRWSLVFAVGGGESVEAEDALLELCRRYWFPLYAYVRKSGYRHEDAEDLTQGFFAEFLERGYFSRADRKRGRFRNFLLRSLKNFMSKEWRRDQTIKRGGNAARIPWDLAEAERRYGGEQCEEFIPEILYDREWARSLIDRVLEQMDSDFGKRNKSELFRQLKRHLWGEARDVPYRELAERAKMSVGAFKIAVHRVREQYRSLLRAEVAETVADPAEVDEELRHLVAVIRQSR